VELVVPLRQGASPRDDGCTLDVLGFADFCAVVNGSLDLAARATVLQAFLFD